MNYFERWRFLSTLVLVSILVPASARAQHKLFRFNDAPGAIAHKRLVAEPGIAFYDQPVSVVLTDGGEISYWDGGSFVPMDPSQSQLGMQVGPVYQLKVSSVFRGRVIDVYPTVEMVDRLYPPQGLANRHPVQVVLTQTDIEQANAGNLVTRVIYLENPDTALPYRPSINEQAILDVGRGNDPFHTADRFGRPMAIVRIGSRQPSPNFDGPQYAIPAPMFADNSPPMNHPQFESVSSGCDVCQPVYTCCPEDIQSLPKSRRDEYICDGNDRELPVVVTGDQSLRGLDIEDTVGHFEKADGRKVVAPSNRVCIYAPRFAAVRRILGPNSTTITQRLNVFNERTQLNTSIGNESSSTALQNVQLQLNKATQTPNQFKERTRGVATDNVVKLFGTRHFFKPFEDLQLIRIGDFVESESARLSLGMQSAIAWQSDLAAQITIKNNQPVIVNDVSKVQELISIETETSADFRLCKLASTITAKSGEPVEFTIRFDNIGRTTIREISIVDNLSPRLEYVEKSAECSVEAEFSNTPNDEGSATLTWKIEQPLKVREGGIIRFRCRVR